jgi:hypothetical protein
MEYVQGAVGFMKWVTLTGLGGAVTHSFFFLRGLGGMSVARDIRAL